MGHWSRLVPAVVLGALLVGASPEQGAFLGDILEVYGRNGLLDQGGFDSLLDTIAQERRRDRQTLQAQVTAENSV